MEIARQGGKNELSAQLELLLLTLYMAEPQNLIKCSPTFKPQTVISLMRLKDKLNDAGFSGIWVTELGYIIRLGKIKWWWRFFFIVGGFFIAFPNLTMTIIGAALTALSIAIILILKKMTAQKLVTGNQ